MISKEEKRIIENCTDNFLYFFVNRLNDEEDLYLHHVGYEVDDEEDTYCFFIDDIEWVCMDDEPLFDALESVCRVGLYDHSVIDNPNYENVYKMFKDSIII